MKEEGPSHNLLLLRDNLEKEYFPMTTALLHLCLTRCASGRKPPDMGQRIAFHLITCIRALPSPALPSFAPEI